MQLTGDISVYLWQRLPLLLLFGGGYLVYQLMAATNLTDAFVTWSLRKSGGRASRLLLYIIATGAALSSFIPNTITVLALLPVLKRLDKAYAARSVPGMSTVLMCAAIYGAAIGGFGSMIGSPANMLLIGALDLMAVPGREGITFLNWFVWSVPLVGMFVLAAWGVTVLLGLPKQARAMRVPVSCAGKGCTIDARQRYAAVLFWTYMAFWVGEAVLRQMVPGFSAVSPVACLAFSGVFLALVFVTRAPDGRERTGPLLVPKDLLQSVPKRGLVFLAAIGTLFALVHWFGWDTQLVDFAGRALDVDMPPVVLYCVTILAVIFLTEVLSNTAVVAAFFAIAYYAATAHGMEPLPLMVGVSVASTCAFMTPVATPTNGLAFGEMRNASLAKMIGLGLVLNLAGAVILTGWLGWVLPRLY